MTKKVKIYAPQNNSMAKAIRKYCLGCSGDSEVEVRWCVIERCPLFPYRFGMNPNVYIKRNKENVKLIRVE